MNDAILLLPVLAPLTAGALGFAVPRRVALVREALVLAAALASLAFAAYLLTGPALRFRTVEIVGGIRYLDLAATHFGALMMVAASVVTLLVAVFLFKHMADAPHAKEFYAYLMLALGSAHGAFLAGHVAPLIAFWGMVLLALFLMATIAARDISPDRAFASAYRVLMLLGLGDVAVILGLGLMWHATGTADLADAIPLLAGAEGAAALVLIAVGVMTKVGAVPFQSWVTSLAETSPAPVMASLPAALDKLLGAYLLARLVMAAPAAGLEVQVFLMAVGALTFTVGALLALVQVDGRKMLGYLAVSSGGYIFLGLGAGNATAAAGAIFYAVNSALWMSCLFLCMGAVERQAGTTSLDRLGGLGRAMPLTFAATLVAGLSMAAVPPLSGFAAKWTVYQGLLEANAQGFWPFLVLSMFGSALTLATVFKLAHAVFMGEGHAEVANMREVSLPMAAAMSLLAALCLACGVLAQLPLTHLVGPVVEQGFGTFTSGLTLSAIWSPTLATGLLVVAVALGVLVYVVGNTRRAKEVPAYVGGEVLPPDAPAEPATQFFKEVMSFGPLAWAHRRAGAPALDAASYGGPFMRLAELYRRLHTGRLSWYIAWAVVGLLALVLALVGLR